MILSLELSYGENDLSSTRSLKTLWLGSSFGTKYHLVVDEVSFNAVLARKMVKIRDGRGTGRDSPIFFRKLGE